METDGRIEIIRMGGGNIRDLTVHFGPHYFIELRQVDGRVSLALGATHHGFKADASARRTSWPISALVTVRIPAAHTCS